LNSPIWIVLVLAIIATILGGPIFGTVAVILWALILAYGISWILSIVVAKMGEQFALGLEQAKTDLGAALPDVLASCPDHCRGDLEIPECSLD
jgi:Flp pilus assembly protein TadB